MFTTMDGIGKFVFDWVGYLRDMCVFVYLSFRGVGQIKVRNLKPIFSTLISQIYFTGVNALPIITFMAIATGSIIMLQSTAQLSLFGSEEMMGNILIVTIIRELGPLLTAFTVIARSGSAVATELGYMQVHREVEALRAMSIEPMSFLVFPRILGGVISLICLAFYFNIIALGTGYIVGASVSDLSLSFYLETLSQALTPQAFMVNFIKNALSGLLIFSIATYHGLKVSGAPHEVPIASTSAVVNSIMAVMAFNLSLSILTFAGIL